MKQILKLIVLSLMLSLSLQADVKEIDINELEKLKSLGVKIIDIRKADELSKTGVIPTSYILGFHDKNGKINKERWLHAFVNLVQNKSIKFVLISTDGKLAKEGANLLKDKKGYKNPYYLEGGINNWLDSNKKTMPSRKKL